MRVPTVFVEFADVHRRPRVRRGLRLVPPQPVEVERKDDKLKGSFVNSATRYMTRSGTKEAVGYDTKYFQDFLP